MFLKTEMETSFESYFLAIMAITLVCWWIFVKHRKRDEKFANLKEIPGPKGLPIIGNIHQMSKVQTHQFCKWSEEFGDIYKLNLANQQLVIISNAKMSKEIFNNANTTGKPFFEALTLYEDQFQPKLGILFSDGALWEVHRRFLLRQLREFGFGKSSMEQLINIELSELLETLEKKQSPITDLDVIFRLPVINSLWNILTSQRFKQDDPKLLRLAMEGNKAFAEAVSGSGLVMFVPILRKIVPELSGYRKIRQNIEPLLKFFTSPVEEHKENFHEDNFRDFIDVYLSEVKKTTDPNSHFHGELAEKQLVNTLFDIFFAGSDTTISTLSWTILYLCKYPDEQTKLQKEIERITGGNSKRVVLADRAKMPYTQALIDEVLRHSSVIADGIAHRALTDMEFQGYLIPKNCWIQPNLYYIHHDPKIWGDPDNFRPERFLSTSEDGIKKYVKSENLQPFQVGRRVCIGETLARDTLFLFIANIFQRFSVEFVLENGEKEPSEFESLPGFFRSPKPFSVVMKVREETDL